MPDVKSYAGFNMRIVLNKNSCLVFKLKPVIELTRNLEFDSRTFHNIYQKIETQKTFEKGTL